MLRMPPSVDVENCRSHLVDDSGTRLDKRAGDRLSAMTERGTEQDAAFNAWMRMNVMRGGNHDSDNFAKRPNRYSDDSSDDDLDIDFGNGNQKNRDSDYLAPVITAPKMQFGAQAMYGQERQDSDRPTPMPDSGDVDEAGQRTQSGDQADLDRIFANVGGLDEAGKPSRQNESPKKSAWSSIGGGIKRFAKGIGGLVKNLSGYNLIRHGLIGANWNRYQRNKYSQKYDETNTALAAHNDPANIARLKEELGSEGYAQRGNQLHNNLIKYDRSMDKARFGLMSNRMHYTGYHMANNFKRAFKDGNIKPKPGGFRDFLGAGFARPDYDAELSERESEEE